jgi:hypothetical protein
MGRCFSIAVAGTISGDRHTLDERFVWRSRLRPQVCGFKKAIASMKTFAHTAAIHRLIRGPVKGTENRLLP